MNVFGKTLGLVLASLALASCGGGGGNGGAFSPAVSSTISLSATSTTLPVNTAGYSPLQYGNPTQATVTIVWRNPNGTLVSGHDIAVSISPPNVAALSCLVDGKSCTDGSKLFGSIPITGINGQATIFVNAMTTAGTATLTVSGQDPTTLATVSQTLTFTITSGVGPAPATVTLTPNPAGIYLPSSGGINTSSISATVLDGAGQIVPDPVSGNSGFDNIQFQIIGNAGNATLSTNSFSGQGGPATTVSSHTVHGVATASFQAGDQTPQGPIQIRATVDRADNNVSNGIQDPVTFTTSVIVSDGKLYSLEITSPLAAPNLPGITINCVTDPCATVSGNVTPGAGTTIPANPDATLSLVVTALAKDRQGNPVIPGTPIRFGSVDEPVGAPGSAQDNQFLLSGSDGNPQEGGTTFTAPTGQFTTAGGGAGPGDALIVFGKTQHGAPQGNSDLESAVTVRNVNSATNLTVAPAFNLNDTTGTSVDYGTVLPYLIGRSLHGNITAIATTDANGVAHAKLNYTVNSVGNSVAIWAQGDGIDRVTQGPNRVTDAQALVYPGLAPASIVAGPNPIPGNTTTSVTVCVDDALGIPLRGVRVGFKFTLNGGGTGKVDGIAGSGSLAHLTGVNGCATGIVVTSGLPVTTAGGSSGQIVFTGAGATSAPVDLVVQLAFLSNAGVGAVCSSGAPSGVANIKAFTTDGAPAPGVPISASCTSLTVTPATATTDSTGTASFTITGPADTTGTCTFTAPGVAPLTVNVKIPGPDDFSPPCGGTP